MKKLLLCLIMFCSALLLCSCKVNWFTTTIDVPWYFIAIPVLVLFVVLYIAIISKTYVCPECNTEFKPKWHQFSVCVHFGNKRVLRCPNCKRKGFCKKKR